MYTARTFPVVCFYRFLFLFLRQGFLLVSDNSGHLGTPSRGIFFILYITSSSFWRVSEQERRDGLSMYSPPARSALFSFVSSFLPKLDKTCAIHYNAYYTIYFHKD
jgi:hypothetical protein